MLLFLNLFYDITVYKYSEQDFFKTNILFRNILFNCFI